MNLVRTEGVVIRGYDFGEGHRIMVIFTQLLGKVRAVARGSRKTKSKFGASLEPLSENHFILYRKPGRPLFTITSCKIREPHSDLREDMNLYGYSSIMSEGVDLLHVEEDPDPVLYDLFSQALDDIKTEYPAPVAWLFMFRLLKCAGYRLNFFSCADCGSKDLEKSEFSPESGGLLCRQCRKTDDLRWPVSTDMIKAVKKLAPDRELNLAVEREIGNIVIKFIKYQFGKEFKSLNFLNIFSKRKKACTFRN
ncbi:DNA repair protein RecO [Elusimicrobiota bacterium]